jgi:hypothetical protein
MMPSDRKQQPLVFIDDAHTFGGAQIALACGIRVILQTTEDSVVCVCTTRTRQAIQAIAGTEERLDFVECPSALPLNIISFPLRLIPFLRIVMRLRRTGVRAWWLNLSGIEFCIAPQMVLMALGETSHAWLHNTQSFAFFNGNSSRLRRWLSSIRDQIAAAFPVLAAINYILGVLVLIPFGFDKVQSRFLIAVGLVNVAIGCALIPHYGALGGVLAMSLTEAFQILGSTTILSCGGIRMFRIHYHTRATSVCRFGIPKEAFSDRRGLPALYMAKTGAH